MTGHRSGCVIRGDGIESDVSWGHCSLTDFGNGGLGAVGVGPRPRVAPLGGSPFYLSGGVPCPALSSVDSGRRRASMRWIPHGKNSWNRIVSRMLPSGFKIHTARIIFICNFIVVKFRSSGRCTRWSGGYPPSYCGRDFPHVCVPAALARLS